MRYPLKKGTKACYLLLLLISLLTLDSCKKEVMVEKKVDAFDQLDNEVKHSEGIYNILFSLQEYPYKQVGIRMSINKNDFNTREKLARQIANPVAQNRYGIFVNNLSPGTTYYYQIYVQDSAGTTEVNSDLFSFITQP